ncbi:MAG: thermonuclease family protein [Methanothrix sp.]|nr:thermonuclease family protein [Methanothrix sp.]
MITRLKPVLILLILASLLPILALGAPDEASGIVTNVVDGDTFDLRIDKTDPRIIYEIERVRLADVDSPEMRTPEGEPAKVFATDTLLEKKVWLDIDDKSKDGRDPYGRLIAVVYLEDPDGSINTTHPFNRLLVDAGHAIVKDFTNNEFDPAAWWSPLSATAGRSTPNVISTTTTSQSVISTSLPSTVATTTQKKFVGSKKSDKYHYPSCRWAKKILPQNEIWFSSSEEARRAGYVSCGVCHPP